MVWEENWMGLTGFGGYWRLLERQLKHLMFSRSSGVSRSATISGGSIQVVIYGLSHRSSGKKLPWSRINKWVSKTRDASGLACS